MKSSKKISLLFPIIFTLSNAYAVSFDCNKASRIFEKAICSNIELSTLDDEINVAYKNAVSINPEIKISQRDWIKSSRLCENNLSTLDKCIKNAYLDRLEILRNQNVIALVQPAISPPVRTPAIVAAPVVAPTPTIVTATRATANSEPQSATAPLNLKGFNLKMSKEDVKKIIPNIEAKDYFSVDGKMRTTLSCGALFSKSKSNCSFTYAGMDVNGIVAAFWGGDLMVFKLIYNTGNRVQVDYNNFKLGSIMKNALISKYGVQDNTSSTYSGRWIFGG